MTVLCAHKEINGMRPELDFSPIPNRHQPHGLAARIGSDCFRHLSTFLPPSERRNLIISRRERDAWNCRITNADLTGKIVTLTMVHELLTFPKIRKIILPVINSDLPCFDLVPADHPTLQSLTLKIANLEKPISSLATSNATVLTHLQISESKISLYQDFTGFARFTHLEQLILNYCELRILRGDFLDQIGSLSSLRDLRLHFAQKEAFPFVFDDHFSCLSGLSRLETLALTCFDIAEIGCETLGKLPCLKTLDLNKCTLVTDAALRSLSNSSSLQVLKLKGRSRVTHPDFASLAKLHQLETLELPDCRKITDAEVQTLEKLSRLTSLILLHGIQMTDTSVHSIAKHSHLKALILHSSAITDDGLEALSKIPTLESINLCCSPQITNRGLAHLALLPQLRELDISFCSNITDEGLRTFAENRQTLGLPAVTVNK